MLEINPIFKEYMASKGLYSEKLMQNIAKDGSIANVDGISDEIKHIFSTAHDVSPYRHVKMQLFSFIRIMPSQKLLIF